MLSYFVFVIIFGCLFIYFYLGEKVIEKTPLVCEPEYRSASGFYSCPNDTWLVVSYHWTRPSVGHLPEPFRRWGCSVTIRTIVSKSFPNFLNVNVVSGVDICDVTSTGEGGGVHYCGVGVKILNDQT